MLLRTVLALTSTETSDGGRLTRQFLSDCWTAISAWTTLPAGFLGGMVGVGGGMERKGSGLAHGGRHHAINIPRASSACRGRRRRWALGRWRAAVWRRSNGRTALETRVDALHQLATRPAPILLPRIPPRCNCPRDITANTHTLPALSSTQCTSHLGRHGAAYHECASQLQRAGRFVHRASAQHHAPS